MLVELNVSDIQDAVNEALQALREVAKDPKQSGDSRVRAALGILDFAVHLDSEHDEDFDDEEYEDDEEE